MTGLKVRISKRVRERLQKQALADPWDGSVARRAKSAVLGKGWAVALSLNK